MIQIEPYFNAEWFLIDEIAFFVELIDFTRLPNASKENAKASTYIEYFIKNLNNRA